MRYYAHLTRAMFEKELRTIMFIRSNVDPDADIIYNLLGATKLEKGSQYNKEYTKDEIYNALEIIEVYNDKAEIDFLKMILNIMNYSKQDKVLILFSAEDTRIIKPQNVLN